MIYLIYLKETDLLYKLPYLLQKDSVIFCLQNQGDMEGLMNAHHIAFFRELLLLMV